MKPVRYFRTMTEAAVRCSLLAVLAVPSLLVAQDMVLVGGTLTVENGTRMAFDGPVQWTIAPSATLVNNGRIELGDLGTVLESPGNPITGLGTEHALYNSTGPAVDIAPGGLGLSLTLNEALGTMELVRGHTVQMEGSGAESVARYFQLLCTPVVGASIDIGFHYDPTELNGSVESDLLLHSGEVLGGPWTAMVGTVDVPAQRITATWSSPWNFVTAFDEDITTGVSAIETTSGFLVWPTISDDVVHIRSDSGVQLSSIALVDATGRTVELFASNAAEGTFSLSVSHLAPGIYVLWLNDKQAFRIVRP